MWGDVHKVHDFWQVIRGDGFLETPFSPLWKGRRGAPLVEEGGGGWLFLISKVKIPSTGIFRKEKE